MAKLSPEVNLHIRTLKARIVQLNMTRPANYDVTIASIEREIQLIIDNNQTDLKSN